MLEPPLYIESHGNKEGVSFLLLSSRSSQTTLKNFLHQKVFKTLQEPNTLFTVGSFYLVLSQLEQCGLLSAFFQVGFPPFYLTTL